MSFSNQTPNYDLPQFLSSDKANWFDLNTAFSVIDTAMQANKTAAANAEGEAANATATAEAVQAAINTIQQNLPREKITPLVPSPSYPGMTITIRDYGPVHSIYGGGGTAVAVTSATIDIGTITNYTIDRNIDIYNAGICYGHAAGKYFPVQLTLIKQGNNVVVRASVIDPNSSTTVPGNKLTFYITCVIINSGLRPL